MPLLIDAVLTIAVIVSYYLIWGLRKQDRAFSNVLTPQQKRDIKRQTCADCGSANELLTRSPINGRFVCNKCKRKAAS